MPSLAQIKVPAREIVVPFDEDVVIKVTYRPLMWSPSEISALRNDKDVKTISRMTEKVIVEWDLTEEDGSPVPITYERLLEIPIPIQTAILTAANEDQTPDAEGKS